jgi:hypothetical protein
LEVDSVANEPKRDSDSPVAGGSQPKAIAVSHYPLEFRIAGVESHELRVPLESRGGCFVGLTNVEVHLVPGQPDPGMIGGLTIDAAVCGGDVVCRAAVTEGGADGLVVVRVSVAIAQVGQVAGETGGGAAPDPLPANSWTSSEAAEIWAEQGPDYSTRYA